MALPLQPNIRPDPLWMRRLRVLAWCALSLAALAWLGKAPAPQAQFIGTGEGLQTISRMLRAAQQRISVALYVLHPGDDPQGLLPQLIGELAAAQQRGVRILVVLERGHPNDPWPPPDNQPAFRLLQEHGIPVAWDSPERRLHAKLLVVDDQVFLGSHNWTTSGLTRNAEAGVWLKDPSFARTCHQWVAEQAQAP